jgi:hypothetical protein
MPEAAYRAKLNWDRGSTMNDLDQTNEEFSSMNAFLFGGYVNAGLSGFGPIVHRFDEQSFLS